MRNPFATVIVPLALLLGSCGAASSQPSCSDPAVLGFLREKLDRPFEGLKGLLAAQGIPMSKGLQYELQDMAATDANGLTVICSAQAVSSTADRSQVFSSTEVVYMLVKNDAGGTNVRMNASVLKQIQSQAYGGVLIDAVRNKTMPGMK